MNEKIVKEARDWIGTPFKSQGRVKQVACDCLGLIIGVAKNLNINASNGLPLSMYDQLNYNLKKQTVDLENLLESLLIKSDKLSVGSLVLIKFDAIPQHLGIISDHTHYGFGLIHSDIKTNKVVEHGLTEDLFQKIQHIYKFCE
ncbi:MAG: hypothetical protein ACK5WS_00385 [Alphaproteobacteria bacterium]|nr:hypothetical protein [Candidatus Jidaibacter sp.]